MQKANEDIKVGSFWFFHDDQVKSEFRQGICLCLYANGDATITKREIEERINDIASYLTPREMREIMGEVISIGDIGILDMTNKYLEWRGKLSQAKRHLIMGWK